MRYRLGPALLTNTILLKLHEWPGWIDNQTAFGNGEFPSLFNGVIESLSICERWILRERCFQVDFRMSPANQFSDTVRYVRDPAALEANVAPDEVVLLSVTQGKYYGLNDSASRVWQLLKTPRSLCEISEILIGEFDVDSADCVRDTQQLMKDLLAERLITPNLDFDERP